MTEFIDDNDNRQLPTLAAVMADCRCGPGKANCPRHHQPCYTCSRPTFQDSAGSVRHVGVGTFANLRCPEVAI
jgi:hypothetical protein